MGENGPNFAQLGGKKRKKIIPNQINEEIFVCLLKVLKFEISIQKTNCKL